MQAWLAPISTTVRNIGAPVVVLMLLVSAVAPTAAPGRGVVARHSGKCLEVGGPAWTAVFQHTCDADSVNQSWRRTRTPDGYFTLAATRHGLCLRATRVTARAGWTGVDLGPCDGSEAQQWRGVPAGFGFFGLGVRAGHGCLDVQGSSTADWTNAVLYPCRAGRLSQQWHSPLFSDTSLGNRAREIDLFGGF